MKAPGTYNVIFFRKEDCVPCAKSTAFIQKVVKKYENIPVIAFAEHELTHAIPNVDRVPTFHVYHNDVCIFDKSGVSNVKALDVFLYDIVSQDVRDYDV
jgi:thiol-disulfide isomerase/thioredoxin